MSDRSWIEWTQATWNPTTEPLLGPLHGLDLTGIHWVITGGESGPAARPIDPDWVRAIRDTARTSGVMFFHKQWGGPHPHRTGRLLDGRTWDHTPAHPNDRAAEHREAACG
jgi:protein gp37